MAFNGNKSSVLGNDAVEVDGQISCLTAGNPFALLRGDGEEFTNLVSCFTGEEPPSAAEKNGKKPRASTVNGKKPQRSFDHEKGEKQSNGDTNKKQEEGAVNGKSSNGGEEEGWKVIKRRQHEIGRGNNERPIITSVPLRMLFGDIPSNILLTPSFNQLKPAIKLIKNNGFNRSNEVRPAAPDQPRQPAAAAKISTERENRMRRRNSAPILVNDKGDTKPQVKLQKDINHVPKGDGVAREATKEAEFNKRKQRKDQVMTLEAYEKQLEEKRKALESLKPQEAAARVVTLDKDFESMRIIQKNKEESIFIKLNSESEKEKKKKVTMDKNGSKAFIPNFKIAGTNNYPRGSKGRREGSKSVKSYEELFPAFPINGSIKQ